ncbi:1449_t:CDS:2 [Cetraspora pellucida]|uniref:1449_t:CDS:1 n=1 Tax=Cetraspora pellucida TaxID=1433469 RepID=A0A9N9BEI2_9GLOM|nr:1449_t:CDS:2 [Cetraspora pellucida]
MTDIQSTIISLRELNTKFTFKISELRKKYADLESKNTKLKQDKEEVETKFLNLEQRDREKTDLIAKLKHDVSLIKEQSLQNGNRYIPEQIVLSQRESNINIPNSVISPAGTSSKSLENNIPISNISDNTSSNEVTVSGNSDTYQDSLTPMSSISAKTISLEKKEENKFMNLWYKEQFSKEIMERIVEKKLQEQETSSTSENNIPNISREQDLIQEISTSIKEQAQSIISPEINHTIKILENNVHPNCDNSRITRDSETQDIICLYQNACDAEKDAIKANRKEILCWCFYAKRFKRMVKDFMINDRIGEKKAKRRVYDFIIKQLPATKHRNLCKQTQKALRIDNLFEKIGMPDIEYIDNQDNSLDDLPEAELSEEAKKTLPRTEISVLPKKVLPEIEILDTKANDSKPQSLITALSDDEPENFFNNDDFFNNNEDDGKFCEQSAESKTHKTLTPEYLKWEAEITVVPGISIDGIRSKLYKCYEKETGLDSWINSESSQIMTNIQPKIDLLELVSERSFEDKEINELEKCILIAQVLLGEKLILEYRPPYLNELELDAFFQKYRIALKVQRNQHQFHSTSWYKNVKKLEDVVNRDRLKRCICQDNEIFLLEVWYDKKPEIVILERIQKIKFINQAPKSFDP